MVELLVGVNSFSSSRPDMNQTSTGKHEESSPKHWTTVPHVRVDCVAHSFLPGVEDVLDLRLGHQVGKLCLENAQYVNDALILAFIFPVLMRLDDCVPHGPYEASEQHHVAQHQGYELCFLRHTHLNVGNDGRL